MSANDVQASPRVRAENNRIATAALKNVAYEDLSGVIVELVKVYGKVRVQMMLDLTYEKAGI